MTMKTCIQPQSQWESLVFDVAIGAADEGDRRRFEVHMETCAACHSAYDELRSSLPLTVPERVDPGEAFWNTFTDRVMERTTGSTAGKVIDRREAHRRPIHLHRLRPVLQIAAAVVILIGGVWIGRSSIGPGSSAGPATADNQAAEGQADIVPSALVERTDAYLDRSRTLLLGLVNFNEGEDDPSSLNILRRKEMAGDLVRESGELQRELSQADQERLRELVADLEVILLQIANLESEYDLPGIEMLKSGVDRKAILFKIQVEEMRRFDAISPKRSFPSGNPAI